MDLASQTTALEFSNEDLNDIRKIVKSLKESGLLIRDVSETVENKANEQKEGFLGMLAAILGVSLLGNLLAGKGVVRGVDGVIRTGEGVIRVGE